MSKDKKEIILIIFDNIKESLESISENFNDEFINKDKELLNASSISKQMINIREKFKEMDKLLKKSFLNNYQNIPFKRVEKIIDILSYHHFYLDTEIIFKVCKNEVSELLIITEEMNLCLLKSYSINIEP